VDEFAEAIMMGHIFTKEEPIAPLVLGDHSLAADFPGLRIKKGVAGTGAKSAKVFLSAGKWLSAPPAIPSV
jgi:hypothetical protein